MNNRTRTKLTLKVFILAILLFKVTAGNAQDTNYKEKHRPQYHFTPQAQWMNDPNGMVYYEGEYHLFYQYHPQSNIWGPMHWGHAVSKNLIHWEHLPIALYPDEKGYIFSGSAVVDWNNTSQFGAKDNPPLVAIFTYHDAKALKAGRQDVQSQGIAYSTDKGRTWKKYKDNPVIPNPGIRDFRDPKIIWSEQDSNWKMVLAAGDHVKIYSSSNLIEWKLKSEFGKNVGAHSGVWECPELFPIKDQNGNIHWVMLVSINPGGPQGGSATQYFVGSFSKDKFIPIDTETRWLDYGADNYAGVTWSDIPKKDNRRIFLGWMSNWQYAKIVPTYVWRSAMTLPRELSLIVEDNKPLLISKPVSELSVLENSSISFTSKKTIKDSLYRINFSPKDTAFKLRLKNDENEEFVVSYDSEKLSLDRSNSGITDFHKDFTKVHSLNLSGRKVEEVEIYVDLSSIEVFINGGEKVMTDIVFPKKPFQIIHIEGENQKGTITTLSSIW